MENELRNNPEMNFRTFKASKWVDNSKISCLERCPREFFLRYILHLTIERPSIAIAYGKAMHTVIEKAVLQSNISQSKKIALEMWDYTLQEEVQQMGGEIPYDDFRAEPSTGRLALEHLFSPDGALYELMNMKSSVKEVELKIDIPIIMDWRFHGRADIVLEYKSGVLGLVDIKTTGWKIESWGQKILVDVQLHGYGYGLKEMGFDINSGAYMVLQSNRRKLKSGAWINSPTIKSGIFPVAVTEDHLSRVRDRMIKAVIQIEGREDRCLWECIWSSCQKLSGICQFHPLCERYWNVNGYSLDKEKEDILDMALSLGYIQHEWHPFIDI